MFTQITNVCGFETHGVPEGVCSDWILSSQRAATEDDEDKDKIGEDVMVDQNVTGHTDPGDRQRERDIGFLSCSLDRSDEFHIEHCDFHVVLEQPSKHLNVQNTLTKCNQVAI